MSKKLTQADVTDFAKFLVGIGDVHYVNDKHIICTFEHEEVCVQQDNKLKKLAVYATNITDPDVIILNPFKETQKSGVREESFFINGMIGTITRLFRAIMKSVIEAPESGKELPYTFTKKLSKPMADIGKTSLDQFNRVFSGEAVSYLLNINYDKKMHVAHVTTSLFDPEFQAGFTGISKKNWKLFEDLFEAILETRNVSDQYKYVATVMGMPKADAVWHVVYMLCVQLNKLAIAFQHVDLKPTIFKKYLDELEQIHQMARWLSHSNVLQEEERNLKKEKKEQKIAKKQTTSSSILGLRPVEAKPIVESVSVNSTTNTDVEKSEIEKKDDDTPPWETTSILPKIPSNPFMGAPSTATTNIRGVGSTMSNITFSANGKAHVVSEENNKGPRVMMTTPSIGMNSMNIGFGNNGGMMGGGIRPVGCAPVRMI